MDPSSLSGLPSDLESSLGGSLLRSEYMRIYLETKLELDGTTLVEVQGESNITTQIPIS